MGFTTKGEKTSPTTYTERDDVEKEVNKMAEEQGWDLSDVRNRAIMYYIKEYKKGTLSDPMVDMGEREDKRMEF